LNGKLNKQVACSTINVAQATSLRINSFNKQVACSTLNGNLNKQVACSTNTEEGKK